MRAFPLLSFVAGLPLLLAACTDPVKPTCPGFIGDVAKPAEAELLYSDGVSPTTTPVVSGGKLPLLQPPQGGFVMYAGVRVRNFDGCRATFRGQLRDPVTNNVPAFDGRNLIDLKVGSDGWGHVDATDLSNLTNIPACPDFGMKDVHGGNYLLEVTATDRGGRMVTASLPIVPTCQIDEPLIQANCICTCSANYTLGKCGVVLDGGSPD